jgi:uncharacterized protein (TIGR02246 family)
MRAFAAERYSLGSHASYSSTVEPEVFGMRSIHALAFVTVFAVLGCGGDKAPSSNTSLKTVGDSASLVEVRAAIDLGITTYTAAMVRGDAAAVAALYTSDVVAVSNTEILRGREAIRRSTQGDFDGAKVLARTDSTEEVQLLGPNHALEIGRWGLTVAGPGGARRTTNGRYLVVWRRDSDGRWRVLSDIGNQAPPAVAAKTK